MLENRTEALAVGKLQVPTKLKSIGNLRRIDFEEHLPGVYFLCHHGEVVYVGQSVRPKARIAQHRQEGLKEFDQVFIRHCQPEELDAVESLFIHNLEPKYNFTMVNGQKISPILADELQTIAKELSRGREPEPQPVTKPSFNGHIQGLPAKRLLALPEVETLTGMKKSSIYEMVKTNSFPPPIKLSRRAVRWPLQHVEDWISAKIAGGAIQ